MEIAQSLNTTINLPIDESIHTSKLFSDSYNTINSFYCFKCKNILCLYPKFCEKCKRKYCNSCTDFYLNSQDKKCKCKNIFFPSPCDESFLEKLKSIQVECEYEGCNEILNYSEFKDHLKECLFACVVCACDKKFYKYEIKEHEEKCDEIKIFCPKCDNFSRRMDQALHNCELNQIIKLYEKLSFKDRYECLTKITDVLNTSRPDKNYLNKFYDENIQLLNNHSTKIKENITRLENLKLGKEFYLF